MRNQHALTIEQVLAHAPLVWLPRELARHVRQAEDAVRLQADGAQLQLDLLAAERDGGGAGEGGGRGRRERLVHAVGVDAGELHVGFGALGLHVEDGGFGVGGWIDGVDETLLVGAVEGEAGGHGGWGLGVVKGLCGVSSTMENDARTLGISRLNVGASR